MNHNPKSEWLFFAASILAIVLLNWIFYELGEPRTVWLVSMLSELF